MDWAKIPCVAAEIGTEEENKAYFADRIVGDRVKGLKWLDKSWIKTVIDLTLLQKRVFTPDGKHVEFKLIQSPYGAFGYKIVDSMGQLAGGKGVQLICQNCGKPFFLKQEREVFLERIHCMCRKCKMHFVATVGGMMDNLHRSLKEKYGHEYPIQIEAVKKKTAQTNLKKYGVDVPLKSQEVKEKVAKTCIERYGVDNPFKLKEFQEKSDETWKKKYGSANIWRTSLGEKVFKKMKKNRSETGNRFFFELEKRLGCKCFYGDEERRILTEKNAYFVDCFIEKYHTIVEYYGTFFHADPRKYAAADVIKTQTAEEIWKANKSREDEIRRATGARLIVVWEDDWEKRPEETLKAVSEEITKC